MTTIRILTQKTNDFFRRREKRSFDYIRKFFIFNIFSRNSLIKICIVTFDNREYNIKFLIDTKIIDYVFVNETITRIIYDKLQIRFIIFSRSKHFNCFNDTRVKLIT